MVNIRPEYNSAYLKNSKPLAEYSWFVEEVRRNSDTMDTGAAVDKAIEDMPQNYVIREFLVEHQVVSSNV